MQTFQAQLAELQAVLRAFEAQTNEVEAITELIRSALLAGSTLFTCGNGGSATDAMHLAQELLGRYRNNRQPLAAICLNSDVGAITGISNDFGYEQVFARKLTALARPGDLLAVFTTSGHSPNVLAALRAAREQGIITIGLLGKDGGEALSLVDYSLVVPSQSTARIQEVHTLILHAICEEVEQTTVRTPAPKPLPLGAFE